MGFTDAKGLAAVDQLLLADLAQSIVVSYYERQNSEAFFFLLVRSDRIISRIQVKFSFLVNSCTSTNHWTCTKHGQCCRARGG